MLLRKNIYGLKTALAIVCIGIGLASCKAAKKTGCSPNVICTMMFKTVSVRVIDAAGNPVKLDEAYTINTRTNETIHVDQSSGSPYYVVLDDGYRKKIQQTTVEFRFIGKKDNKQVIDQKFKIGADCCHINKSSGPEEIVIK